MIVITLLPTLTYNVITQFAFILDCALHDNRASPVLVIKYANSMNFHWLLLPKELSHLILRMKC